MKQKINGYRIKGVRRVGQMNKRSKTPWIRWAYFGNSEQISAITIEELMSKMKIKGIPVVILDDDEYSKKIEYFTVEYNQHRDTFISSNNLCQRNITFDESVEIIKMLNDGIDIGEICNLYPNKKTTVCNFCVAYLDGFVKMPKTNQKQLNLKDDEYTVTDSMSVDLNKPLTREMVAEDLSKRIDVLESKIDSLIDNHHNGCQKCEIEDKESKGWIKRMLRI